MASSTKQDPRTTGATVFTVVAANGFESYFTDAQEARRFAGYLQEGYVIDGYARAIIQDDRNFTLNTAFDSMGDSNFPCAVITLSCDREVIGSASLAGCPDCGRVDTHSFSCGIHDGPQTPPQVDSEPVAPLVYSTRANHEPLCCTRDYGAHRAVGIDCDGQRCSCITPPSESRLAFIWRVATAGVLEFRTQQSALRFALADSL